MIRVVALGWRAEAALRASAGRVRVVAALSSSCYAVGDGIALPSPDAGGQLIWLGAPDAALHARAVLALGVPAAPVGAILHVAAPGVPPWRPSVAALDPALTRAGARALHASLPDLGPPRGLGRLLVPGHDDAVAARARPHAVALASACAGDDARGITEAGHALLGLGAGLTPSGDDYVGGALFARCLLGRAGAVCDPATAALLEGARERTHPISAQLLADLAAGEGWAPLHALVAALGMDRPAATAAARSLVAIGHSSGWDLLAGVLAALLGPAALAACPAVETGPL